jgi:predicted ABC-class ATPase
MMKLLHSQLHQQTSSRNTTLTETAAQIASYLHPAAHRALVRHLCCLPAPPAINCSCLQQKIADRKSKMLAVELDDLRDVSGLM